jgi:hypothetical protein
VIRILFFLMLLFPALSQAQGKDYELCIVWGVAGAVEDGFIQSLAGRVLERKKLFRDDQVCSSLRQSGFSHGKSFSAGSTQNRDAEGSWLLYQDFRDSVMDRLIDEMGL